MPSGRPPDHASPHVDECNLGPLWPRSGLSVRAPQDSVLVDRFEIGCIPPERHKARPVMMHDGPGSSIDSFPKVKPTETDTS